MDGRIALTELIREFATLIMLAATGYLAGKKSIERIAIFIFAFGWWDLFYYIFLKLLLGWPSSFFTWDILFLLPVIWTGPVLAPVINAATMILLGTILFIRSSAGLNAKLKAKEWLMLVSGSLIIFVTYIQDYLHFMVAEVPFGKLMFPGNSELIMQRSAAYVPAFFNWWLFLAGETLLVAAIFLYRHRMKRTKA